MPTIITTLTTEATFSDDNLKRYLLRKTWDENKPKLAIIMLAPSEAAGIELDNTTLLVLNNSSRLGYGGVDVLNLFATLNDFGLREAEDEDNDNLNAIVQSAQEADIIIYAAGVGKAKSKVFQRRQEQVLTALWPYENKLHCLTNESGRARLQHPLSPAVRTWHLSPLKVSELIADPEKKGPKGTDTKAKKVRRKSTAKGAE